MPPFVFAAGGCTDLLSLPQSTPHIWSVLFMISVRLWCFMSERTTWAESYTIFLAELEQWNSSGIKLMPSDSEVPEHECRYLSSLNLSSFNLNAPFKFFTLKWAQWQHNRGFTSKCLARIKNIYRPLISSKLLWIKFILRSAPFTSVNYFIVGTFHEYGTLWWCPITSFFKNHKHKSHVLLFWHIKNSILHEMYRTWALKG